MCAMLNRSTAVQPAGGRSGSLHVGHRAPWGCPRFLQRASRLVPGAGYQKGYNQGSQGGYPPGSGYNQGSQGGYSQGSGYYPPVPSYTPTEPSAPPLDPGTPTYPSSSYPSSGYNASDYSSSANASSPVLDEAAVLAEEDLQLLRDSAGKIHSLSTIGFWLQFALSIVSAGILLFSSGFVPKVTSGFGAADISKWLTLVGIVAAFISSMFAHGFKTLSRKLQNGGTVARTYMVTTLLTNNAINLGGIAITVLGLQASVGTLVAKSLSTAISGPSPYQYSQSGAGVVSLDVFSLQASTNTLLCHVIGLIFTNIMLRIVNRQRT